MSGSGWDAAKIVAVATVTVAIANLVFLWFNARATRQFEERMQRAARTHARIEGPYRDFVTLMHRVRVLSDHKADPLTYPHAPDPIEDREVSEIISTLRTYGSDVVVDEGERWADLHSAVVAALVEGKGQAEAKRRIEAMREQERTVRGLIRDELTA